MIAVIADDLTGAAELAGISLRYGLKVELCVGEVGYKNADVLVVSTDSRSLNKQQAITVTEKKIEQVLQLNPQWIYKKIDSVLRGYVLEEAKTQMKLMNRSRAFIMPANPSLNRTIKNGEYFVDGVKITETGFAHDPEFPIKTNSVKEILGNEVGVLKSGDEIPGKGIVVGEVSKFEDYNYWSDEANGETILVGAGDFFTALLDKYYQPQQQRQFEMQSPHLYVCGTAFNERKEFIKKLSCVSWLPEVVNENWLKKTGEIIKKEQKVVVAIDESADTALSLRTKMAKAIKKIVAGENIKEIFIEGGATATAILQELRIAILEPTDELSRGVVRMKFSSPPSEGPGEVDLFITVKPGSYELPEQIKRLYNS
jgi:D-threonate/D-erythronate kinase